jgi:hypothetical protein
LEIPSRKVGGKPNIFKPVRDLTGRFAGVERRHLRSGIDRGDDRYAVLQAESDLEALRDHATRRIEMIASDGPVQRVTESIDVEIGEPVAVGIAASFEVQMIRRRRRCPRR